MQELFTPDELATRLGMKKAALANWRYLGQGPKFIKTGRSVRYRVSDVEAWMDAQTRQQSGTAISA